MKTCNKCKITIATSHDYCPLCHQTLEGSMNEKHVDLYPPQSTKELPVSTKAQGILMFIGMFSIITLIILNIYNTEPTLWSLIPIGSIVYFFLLVKFAFFLKTNVIIKVTGITAFTTLLVIVLNVLTNQDVLWSVDYVTPSLLIINNTIIFMILVIQKNGIKQYALQLLLLILLSAVPLLLYAFGVNDVYIMSLITHGHGLLILFYMIIFYPRVLKEQLKKTFHI